MVKKFILVLALLLFSCMNSSEEKVSFFTITIGDCQQNAVKKSKSSNDLSALLLFSSKDSISFTIKDVGMVCEGITGKNIILTDDKTIQLNLSSDKAVTGCICTKDIYASFSSSSNDLRLIEKVNFLGNNYIFKEVE